MRILIVSFYFPPYNSIAAVRVGKTARYLVTLGHEVRVVTADRQPFQQTLALEIPSERVRYTSWIDVKKPIHMLSGGQARIDLGDIPPGAHQAWRRSPIWSLLKTFLFFPDEQVGWLPFAVRKCAQTVNQWKPDVILASSGPTTALVVAWLVSKRHQVPWVADLRDLWVDNHYYSHPEWRKKIERRLERRVLSSASGLITVSEPLASTLRRGYQKPTRVVLNGIDFDDYPAHPVVPFRKGSVQILYTGRIYEGKRDPTPLFQALKLLGPLKEKLQVAFYGDNLNSVAQLARRTGVQSLVSVHPPVPYRESLRMQSESDALLLLLWNHPGEKGVYTGKLFEYLGAGRPILAVGPQDGAAADLIRARNAGFLASDPRRIAEKLKVWIDLKAQSGGIPSVPRDGLASLSRASQTGVLSEYLRELLCPN
jgi:glycosyltransferase involved in cell wall biosynthesis